MLRVLRDGRWGPRKAEGQHARRLEGELQDAARRCAVAYVSEAGKRSVESCATSRQSIFALVGGDWLGLKKSCWDVQLSWVEATMWRYVMERDT